MVRFIVGASALGAIVLGIVITAFVVAFVADFKGDDARAIDATLRVRIATLQTRINNLMLVIEELAGTLGYTAPGTYADGDLLIGDTDTDNLSVSTLIPLDGVSIDNGAGTITVGLLQPVVNAYMIHGPISSTIPAGAIRVCADLSGAGASGSAHFSPGGGSGGGSGTYVYDYCVSLAGVVGPITGAVGLGGPISGTTSGVDGTASHVIITSLSTVYAYGGGGGVSNTAGGAGGGSNSGAVANTPGSNLASLANGGISGATGGTASGSGEQAWRVIAGAAGGRGAPSGSGVAGGVMFAGAPYTGGAPGAGVTGGGAAGIGGNGGNGGTSGGFDGLGCGAGGGGGFSSSSGAGHDGCVTLTYYFY